VRQASLRITRQTPDWLLQHGSNGNAISKGAGGALTTMPEIINFYSTADDFGCFSNFAAAELPGAVIGQQPV
jgi:hypothetical protein